MNISIHPTVSNQWCRTKIRGLCKENISYLCNISNSFYNELFYKSKSFLSIMSNKNHQITCIIISGNNLWSLHISRLSESSYIFLYNQNAFLDCLSKVWTTILSTFQCSKEKKNNRTFIVPFKVFIHACFCIFYVCWKCI